MKVSRRSHIEGSHRNQQAIRTGVGLAKRKAAAARTRADAQGDSAARDGAQRDSTERKQAEAQLQLSEERLKYALEGANDGLWDWNVQTGAAYFSPRWKAMIGYAEDELPNTYETWDARLHPDDKPRVLQVLQAHFADAAREYEPEFRMLTKAGEWIWIQARGRVVERDRASRPLRMVGTHTDITARKQAEKALRESEERFRSLSEAAFEGILIHDQGVILNANQAIADLLSYRSPEDLIGKQGLKTLPFAPESRERIRANLRSGSTAPLEIMVMRPDGSMFPAETQGRDITFNGRKLRVVAMRDITERRKAEMELRESASKILAIFSAIGDGITVSDIRGRILESNNAAFRLHGFEHKEEFLHTNIAELVSETDRERMIYDGRTITQSGGMGAFEYTLRRKDGSLFDGEIRLTRLGDADKGSPGIIAITRDITERKQVEEKLQQQNQRLKVLREIDAAILAADSVENIVRAALDHIRALIDCRRASIAFMDWGASEVLVFEVRTIGETSIPKGTRIPLARYQDILQILSKNQPALMNDLTALADPPPQIQSLIKEDLRSMCMLPLFSRSSLIGAFSMSSEIPGFFDEEKINLVHEVVNQMAIAITQNNLLQALRDLNAELEGRVIERTAQLQAANKELEAFSYSVSHDLRAPLRAIDGFSQALTRKYAAQLGEDGAHYLTRIQENTRRMSQLIDDLLSLARITRCEMKQDHVNFSKMAREIADELQSQEPGRRVHFVVEEQVETRGDAGLLKIVLQNLIGNAFKFTSTRSQAKIQFGLLPTPPAPLSSGEESGGEGEKVYFVRDNGVGFDMAYANKLFGAFQRLHAMDEFPGTGIGLATIQRIIHRHGGRVWAEAAQDQGAAFYFTLGGKP